MRKVTKPLSSDARTPQCAYLTSFLSAAKVRLVHRQGAAASRPDSTFVHRGLTVEYIARTATDVI